MLLPSTSFLCELLWHLSVFVVYSSDSMCCVEGTVELVNKYTCLTFHYQSKPLPIDECIQCVYFTNNIVYHCYLMLRSSINKHSTTIKVSITVVTLPITSAVMSLHSQSFTIAVLWSLRWLNFVGQ